MMRENPATEGTQHKEQVVPPDYTSPVGPEDDRGFVPIYPDEREEIVGTNPDVSGPLPDNPTSRADD